MSNRPIRRRQQAIDPMFFIPEGVDELVYSDEESVGGEESETFADVDISPDTDLDDNQPDETDYAGNPDTPQILSIVSQTIRTSSTGAEVVDVVFDVEDIEDVSNYELRVTKI